MSIIVENQQNYSNNTNNIVSNFIDNTVSAIILVNKIIFSFMDSWKPLFRQGKENSRQMSNLGINATKTFEKNTIEIGEVVKENTNSNVNATTKLINSNIQQSTSLMQKFFRAMPIVAKNVILGLKYSSSFLNSVNSFLNNVAPIVAPVITALTGG